MAIGSILHTCLNAKLINMQFLQNYRLRIGQYHNIVKSWAHFKKFVSGSSEAGISKFS